jgi:polyphosphate kinase
MSGLGMPRSRPPRWYSGMQRCGRKEATMAAGRKRGKGATPRKKGRAKAEDEVLADAKERATIEQYWHRAGRARPRKPAKNYRYVDELAHLQVELIKLQEWVRMQGLRVAVIFEGRDAAGKGGVIKRIAECLNPRICRIVALGTPTERERSQWYFQRYVPHLPAAGEIVLFDRSWYNRAGVERVMGFCTEAEYEEFLRSCPQFEEMLIRSGIILVKYWFSVNDEEQERRFQERIRNPTKRWKLSPMDIESRKHWVEYSRAKDLMFAATDRKKSPWWVVNADDKKKARLNCIAHLLHQIPYENMTPVEIDVPPRQADIGYKRPKKSSQRFVDSVY